MNEWTGYGHFFDFLSGSFYAKIDKNAIYLHAVVSGISNGYEIISLGDLVNGYPEGFEAITLGVMRGSIES